MSHFTVLVIGDDVEGQLARYDENTQAEGVREDYTPQDLLEAQGYFDGIWAEYQPWVEDGRPEADMMKENHRYHRINQFKAIDRGEFPPPHAPITDVMTWYHGDGTEWEEVDGDLVFYRYNTYNPDSKWDWYSIGGRWSGFFKLKEGAEGIPGTPGLFTDPAPEGRADIARKGDIDFDGMMIEVGREAAQAWDAFYGIVSGHGWEPVDFADFMPEEEDIEVRRRAWWNMPVIKDLKAANVMPWGSITEAYLPKREDHIARAARGSAVTYALVTDGEWYERGQMGWFGLSSDDMSQDDWHNIWWKIVGDLDDDTMLTVVDCHI